MPEAEEVLIDASRRAASLIAELWRRGDAGAAQGEVVELSVVRRRLELQLEAVLGQPWLIRAAQPPAPPTMLSRLLRRGRAVDGRAGARPGTDGVAIFLPPSLSSRDGDAVTRYRVMAFQQALRCRRGTAGAYPFDESPLVQDVYLMCETALVDRELLQLLPGMTEALLACRRAALARMPPENACPSRAVHALWRHIVSSPVHRVTADAAGPDGSLQWARYTASHLVPAPARYRGWPADELLGEITAPEAAACADGVIDAQDAPATRSSQLPRRPRVRAARPEEDDKQSGAWMVQTSEPMEHAEDPMGTQRPADRDSDANPAELADSLGELTEARLVSTPHKPAEILASDLAPPRTVTGRAQAQPVEQACWMYPEWDYRAGRYRAAATRIRLQGQGEGSPQWVDDVLARRHDMLQQVRRRFQAIEARRRVFPRQADGEEIDLDALVDDFADRLAGCCPSGRVYRQRRPARRDAALSVLIDISASTDASVAGRQRVIDVEKETLLVLCVALDTLRLPFAIQTFSGRGPHHVAMRGIKRFDEAYSAAVARRIASLEPDEYTRVGAALRHATALLLERPARHRLLLLLSDGKPNDCDHYEGRYGIEDMRQAVCEALMLGVRPFAMTVDRDAAAYLPYAFGPGRYAVLPRPDRLPMALLEWLKTLSSGG